MIQVQATKIAAQVNKTDFKATNGWLHRFLKRYNYTHVNLHGEAGDVDTAKVAEEIERIREQLKEFDIEFIFNMDETGLFYRCFPRGTYVSREETAAGVNSKTARGSKAMKAKDRCTVIACGNVTGSLMVPLAIIGTSKQPMVFRHVRKPPCPYYAQTSAWLDANLCQRWFDEVFVPFVNSKTEEGGSPVGQLPLPQDQEQRPPNHHHLLASERHLRLPAHGHGDPLRTQVLVQDGDGDQAGGPHRRLGHRPCTKYPKGLPGPQ
ncbi:unnamed protein product [Ectocarpus sp. 4 AP-2014]